MTVLIKNVFFFSSLGPRVVRTVPEHRECFWKRDTVTSLLFIPDFNIMAFFSRRLTWSQNFSRYNQNYGIQLMTFQIYKQKNAWTLKINRHTMFAGNIRNAVQNVQSSWIRLWALSRLDWGSIRLVKRKFNQFRNKFRLQDDVHSSYIVKYNSSI